MKESKSTVILPDIDVCGRQAAIAFLAVGAAISVGSEAQAEMLKTKAEANNGGNYTKQTLTYNTETGDTTCSLVRKDPDTYFNSLGLALKVERKIDGSWKVDNKFEQPVEITDPETSSHKATVEIEHTFPNRKIARLADKTKTRINCYGSESSLSLKIPKTS